MMRPKNVSNRMGTSGYIIVEVGLGFYKINHSPVQQDHSNKLRLSLSEVVHAPAAGSMISS